MPRLRFRQAEGNGAWSATSRHIRSDLQVFIVLACEGWPISIIEVKELTKVFDDRIRAVDGISFALEKGEILGFLGPNGAGKTTTLNILSTLLRPTSGTATVNGHDIIQEPDAVRRSIGFVFQDPTLDTELTGNENLDFHGRLYGIKKDLRQRRIKEMLEVVQLSDRADDLVKTYSGGMKRRLEIARGLLHYPKILFLDEPTLGLDPQTRRSIWEHIQRLNRDEDVTIILTTHYTEEADYLCGRALIIDFGKIVALDTPDRLKARLEGDVVSLTFKETKGIADVRAMLEKKHWISSINTTISSNAHSAVSRMMHTMRAATGGAGMNGMMPSLGGGDVRQVGGMLKRPRETPTHGKADENDMGGGEEGARCLNLLVDDGGRRIPEIVKLVDGAGVVLESVELHKPTLDDVFLTMTGRNIRDERGSFIEMIRRHRIVRQARGRR